MRQLKIRPMLWTAALVVVCGTLVAGCGGSSSSGKTALTSATTGPRMLDTKKVAQAITDSIRSQRNTSAKVTCPAAVTQAKGVNFVCEATSKFGVTEFAVVQQDAAGHVTYVAAKQPQ